MKTRIFVLTVLCLSLLLPAVSTACEEGPESLTLDAELDNNAGLEPNEAISIRLVANISNLEEYPCDWYVSFEIFMPRDSTVESGTSLKTSEFGISDRVRSDSVEITLPDHTPHAIDVRVRIIDDKGNVRGRFPKVIYPWLAKDGKLYFLDAEEYIASVFKTLGEQAQEQGIPLGPGLDPNVIDLNSISRRR